MALSFSYSLKRAEKFTMKLRMMIRRIGMFIRTNDSVIDTREGLDSLGHSRGL